MSNITKIALGKNGPLVSKLGLGCMRMSPVWGGQVNNESESIATIQEALDSGINFLNTGDFYGAGHNELLVGKAIKGRRDDAFISVKFGAIFYGGQWLGLDLRPIAIKNFINYSLVRYLGVSEITADQLRKAHNIHPVTALEIGYSLADRQIESDLLPAAKELGIGVVAFANTAEGLLTGEMKAPLAANDYHNHFSRFQGDNLIKNLEKVEVFKQIAKEKRYTPTQLAIAWVNAQGDHIMPLVSMSRRSRLPENMQAMEIAFTPEEMNTLNTHFSPGAILGGTYLQR